MSSGICGIRLAALFAFYRARLREHPVQELLAGAGIAVGVALVFAVQVANNSITGSAQEVVGGIAGSATLQMAARSEAGFDQRIATRAAALDGVRRAAPLLRTRTALVGPGGRESVELIGATQELGELGGGLTRNFGRSGLRLTLGIALPAPLAASIGTASGDVVRLLVDGRVQSITVGAVLDQDTLGPLTGSRAALGPLELIQAVTGQPGRVSQVLIEAEPGSQARVVRELERIASGRISVMPAQAELKVLREAAKPNDQSTRLFAGIAAMVGFLFSLNAMLFTVAERRRFIADLRMEGARPRQVLTILGFEALALGLMASLAGLALGELLSRLVFSDAPDYLTFAFPVGTQRVVDASAIGIAFGAGILATVVASLRPALDLRPSLPIDAVNREGAEPGEAIGRRTTYVLLAVGGTLVALTTAIVLLVPRLTVVGGVTLALAALLIMPAAFGLVLRRLDRATARTRRFNMLGLALMELRGTTTRSMALAGVAALAVYGSVSIGGARNDLVRGLDHHTQEWLSNADLWVTTGGQDLMTDAFPRTRRVSALSEIPVVDAIRLHRGGFIDLGDRRLWVIGRPVDDRVMIPPSQLLNGDLDLATSRLRRGGWATVSEAVAEEQGRSVGDRLSLPTPSGDITLRIAAITTNMGWIPGAVTINERDYETAMDTRDPSAIEIDLVAGIAPSAGARIVARALGPDSGLRVQTRQQRELQYYDFGRQGVARLGQIAFLLLIAAALAVTCALIALVLQRRPRLAAMKIQGARRSQLWQALLIETGLLVSIGCAVGAVLGLYGHFLAGRYLRETTGFASPFSLGAEQLLLATAVVTGIAVVVSAIPGYLAASTPVRAGFQE